MGNKRITLTQTCMVFVVAMLCTSVTLGTAATAFA